MSSNPFCTSSDVEAAMLRPLNTNEANYVPALIDQASALLRLAAPSIDDRINRFNINPSDLTSVSPAAVASVVAGVIKRYMSNPHGLASESETVGGVYAKSTSYALRGEKETRGTLQITSDDLKVLFPNRKRLRAGTMRLQPALAPRPVGRYGPLATPGVAIAAAIMYDANTEQLVSEVVEWTGVIAPGDPSIQ